MADVRHVLFFEKVDGDFVYLRLVFFHETFFETDLLDVLERAGVELSDATSALIEIAQEMEVSPTPTPLNPIIAPSVNDFLSMCPLSLDEGLPFPLYAGNVLPGLVLNPGGDVTYEEIPFDCRLMDLIYNGLNFFAQSGMLNLDLSLVTNVSLVYKRTGTRAGKRMDVNLANYRYLGKGGDFLFYAPLTSSGACGDVEPVAGYQEQGLEIYHYMTPLMAFPDIEGTPDEMPFYHFLTGSYRFDLEFRSTSYGLVYPMYSNVSSQYGSQYPGAVSGVYPSDSYLTGNGYKRVVSPVTDSIQIMRDFQNNPCWLPGFVGGGGIPGYIIHGSEFVGVTLGGGLHGGLQGGLVALSTGVKIMGGFK